MTTQQDIIYALEDLEKTLSKDFSVESTIATLKAGPLLHIASHSDEIGVKASFQLSARLLHVLGQANLPMAVGICMNQYILTSIAAFPIPKTDPLYTVRSTFLSTVRDNKWLLAVSSFDDFVRGQAENWQGVKCKEVSGGYLCNGIKNFQSMASHADMLLFSALKPDGEVSLCYVPISGNKNIELSGPLLGRSMRDADTRAAVFRDVWLSPIQVIPNISLTGGASLHSLTRAVFGVMAMCPYLGGARRALDEVDDFLKRVVIETGPLADLDGNIAARGRIEAAYSNCMDMIAFFFSTLDGMAEGDLDTWMQDATLRSMRIKHHISEFCETVSHYALKAVGTRSFLDDNIVGKLSQQLRFATLHPVTNPQIERLLGGIRDK